ncbi:MAG: hypothetical protein R3D71_00200 [Rickettsiales bacterium]
MALFLFRFYPVLLPLLIYYIWLYFMRRKARKNGDKIPQFRDGPVFLLLISSLVIAILCFLFIAFSTEGKKGNYIPPHMEGDSLIPGQIVP